MLCMAQNTQMHSIIQHDIWQSLENVLHEGGLYIITNVRVIPAYGSFRPVPSQKILKFLHSTVVNLVADDFVIPFHKFELVHIRDLYDHSVDTSQKEKQLYATGIL